jgi:thioredoxin:protein disulfide reductase
VIERTLSLILFALLLAGCLLPCPARAAAQADDLLPPEEAFRFSAQLVDAREARLRWRIADGYYMYRDKFRFSAQPDVVALGSPQFPPGKIKDDEFFGPTETYRGGVVVRLPISMPAGTEEITLETLSQGCADVGVCYTPQRSSARLRLAAMDGEVEAAGDAGGVLSRLRKLTADPEPEFLPVDQAFKVSVRARDAHTLVAEFVPAKGYYLYRDKLGVAPAAGSGVVVKSLTLPRGEIKNDPNFGDTEVFHTPVQAVVALGRKRGGEQHISVETSFQGCADAGLCYPPERKRFDVVLAALDSGAPTQRAPAKLTAAAAASAQEPTLEPPPATDQSVSPAAVTAPVDESSRVAQILHERSFWGVVASFFGFGVLLSFTPCVFPMIPILSGIIVGQGHRVSRGHALLLTSVYVLGMAVTYAAAGVAAGLSGTLLATALQTPWVLGAFALLFVGLALSMFGVYDLQLPTALQSSLSDASNRMRGGTFWGVLAMGVLSAVIVGPCVAAPLAGALLYINQTRDAVLGGSGLFAMALGMGVPLLAVGASAGALMPRAGAWMQTVKNFFGVVLLGLAIWILAPVLPAVVQMLLWAGLLICAAIYLHALDALPHNASGYRKLWKGVGVIALLLGVALLIGALSGGRDILQPLAGLRTAGSAGVPAQPGPRFVKVVSVADLEEKLTQAAGRPVMLDFYADWCVSCKEMERFTFTDPGVRARMERMVLLKADVTANSREDAALLQRFGLFGPPGMIFFDADGNQLARRVIGFQPAEQFAASLDAVLQPAS